MIISTGTANQLEISEAVMTARDNGCPGLVLLHCTSSYPAPMADANVRTVGLLAESSYCVAGLSDHTLGIAASVAAVAVGACVIETHFTISRADGGPDAEFSLEPDEFTSLVRECRNAWDALGEPGFDLQGSEGGSLAFRRPLYVVTDILAGEPFTAANVRSIRPGYGMAPRHLPELLGKKASCDLFRGDPLTPDMLGE
jgi:sialic acid synthase SpsE